MQNNRNRRIITIDVIELITRCIKNWWLIALITVIFGGATLFVTMNFITPTYQSTVKIYVNNQDISVNNVSISTQDLSASVQLTDLYEVILNTKDTLDVIIDNTGLDMDYTELMSKLETTAVNETQVFQVTVTDTSPENARWIAYTIGEVLPYIISDIIEGADAKIVEHAIVPIQKSAPSYSKCTLKGAFIGFILAVIAITVQMVTDVTIRNEDDLLNIVSDLPVLTHIPDFDERNDKSGRYAKNYYGRVYGGRGTKT